MIPLGDEEIRRRQRARSLVTAVLLAGLALLFFAIGWAKMASS